MVRRVLVEPLAAGDQMDTKGFGYTISILSVFLLGVVAWPKPDEPQWKALATIVGMLASILGMAIRYRSHRQEKRQLQEAERRADRSL